MNRPSTCKKLSHKLKSTCIVLIKKVSVSIRCTKLRPIGILPVVEKVLQSILYDKLKGFLQTIHFLSVQQFEFKSKHSEKSG